MTADQIAQLLADLGAKLTPPAQYVFQLAVQRVIIESSVRIIAGLVVIVAYGLFLRFAKGAAAKYAAEEHGSYSDNFLMDSDTGLPILFIGIIGAIAGLAAGAVIVTATVSLLTPEYTALSNLLSTVTGK